MDEMKSDCGSCAPEGDAATEEVKTDATEATDTEEKTETEEVKTDGENA